MPQHKNSAEDRESRRVPLRIAVRLVGEKIAATGMVRDITENGVQILSPRNIPAGSRLEISLHMPHSSYDLSLHLEVRWSRTINAPGIRLLGCRFLHTLETRGALKAFLGELTAKPRTTRYPGPARNLRQKHA